jgi:hypothetical protein
MKKLQRLGLATVFSVLLTSTMLAGEIHTPGIAQPTPTPSPTSAMIAGDESVGERSGTSNLDVSETASFTEVALDLLQIMLSVF